ncbi:MAG TPA: hypothetical protein DHU73_01935, partial [Lachnoclostridium sp.]|nr:hypothetical protein [Lachnoclostridium sp.]
AEKPGKIRDGGINKTSLYKKTPVQADTSSPGPVVFYALFFFFIHSDPSVRSPDGFRQNHYFL